MNAVTAIAAAPFDEQIGFGFNPPETATFDEWAQAGRKLCTAHRNLKWAIGDWLIWGSDESRFGRRALEEANAIFHSDVDRFGPILDTCRRFPEPARHKTLTFGHHLAVMQIDDDAEAQIMLAKAETERLTVPALKATVRVTTNRQTTMLEDDDPVDREYRAMAQAWNRCSCTDARRLLMEAIEEVGVNGEIVL